MTFLSLIFGWWIYKSYSKFISLVLKIKGIKVGGNFYIQGSPYLKIRGNPYNIIIDENVSINGNIDLRNRENGKIIISKDVTIDTNSRFVAANNATLNIGKGCKLGSYLIFNCGEDITVGEDCIFGGFCYFQSSNHGIKKDELIKYQDHTYGKIIIGKGAWFGARVTVLPGVTIGEGAVIGANSVVTKDIPSNSIAVGNPAKVISYRN